MSGHDPQDAAKLPDDQQPQPPTKRSRWRWWMVALAVLCLALLGIIAYIHSGYFQETVRRRLITALEQTTGGRVELRAFEFIPSRLEVSLRGLVLHGTESSLDEAFFSAKEIHIRWRLVSIWNLEADLASLRVQEPTIRLLADAQGRTNLPRFPAPAATGPHWSERLFDLNIQRLEVLRGNLQWNDQRIPLGFQARNFRFLLLFDHNQQKYSGQVDFQDSLLISPKAVELPVRGEVQFLASTDRLEFPFLALHTEKSHLQAKGTLENFHSPLIRLQHTLQLDWEDAARTAAVTGWRGNLNLQGETTNAENGWRMAGDLQARAISMGIRELSDIQWTSHSSIRLYRSPNGSEASTQGPWRADLENLSISTLGGTLDGSSGIEFVTAGPRVEADLNAQRLSLPALSRALHSLPVPLETLSWASALSGPVHVSFSGLARNLQISADWQAEVPSVVPIGFIPLSGHLQGNYDRDQHRLESQGTVLQLPQTSITANGLMMPAYSDLSVSLHTENFSEIHSLVNLLDQRASQLPLSLGTADVQGVWSGGTGAPQFLGTFQLANFVYDSIAWDRFSGRLSYQSIAAGDGSSLWSNSTIASSPQNHLAELAIDSGNLVRQNASVEFSGKLGLEAKKFVPSSPFTLQATITGAAAGELLNLLKLDYPVQGNLQATIEASGTREAPQGRGTATLSSAVLYGEPFDQIVSPFVLQPGWIISTDALRAHKSAHVLDGKFTYHFRTKRFDFTLDGNAIPLQEFQFLRTKRMPVQGLAQFHLLGEGSLDQPSIQGQIEVREFSVGRQEAGSLLLTVSTQNRQAHLEARVNFFGSQWNGQGDIHLEKPYKTTATLNLEDSELSGFLLAFQLPADPIRGRVNGNLQVEGELQNPSSLIVQGEMTRFIGSIGSLAIRNVNPLRFQYRDQLVRLEPVRFSGDNINLDTQGTIQIDDDPVLDITAKGLINLAMLELIDPGINSSGPIQIDANLTGTLRNPVWRGQLSVSDGSFRYGHLPNSLTNLKGNVVFEGNRGILENFSADSGGGVVRFDGFIAYASPAGFQWQLQANAQNVRVRYPPGVSTTVDARLALSGAPASSLLTGRVEILRESVSPGFDLITELLRSRESPAAPIQADILRNMRMDVEVVTAAEIRLETGAARNLQGDVNLRMQGTLASPVLLGRIGIQQGEVVFAGKSYNVTRGDVSFINPARIEPVLNITVEARVQQYDISLDFSGPPDRLLVTYRSDPPLPSSDILALLVAGSSRQTTSEPTAQGIVPQVGAQSLLSQALSAQIGNRLDRIFGAGRIRVDPQLAGFGQPANASVALEQQLSDNFTIVYVTDVTSVRRQIIQGEWIITPRYSLGAIRDENGLFGINLQMKLRFR